MGRVGALTLLERREEQSPLQPALPGVDTARRWPRPWLPGASSWGATTGTASERQCPAGEAGAEDREDRGKGGGRGGSGRRGHRQDLGRHGVAAGKRRACTASWREASERGLGPESLAVSVTLAFRGWNWDPEGRSLERVLGTNCQRTLCVTVRRENRHEMRLVSAQRQTAGADVGGVWGRHGSRRRGASRARDQPRRAALLSPRRHGQDRRRWEGTGFFCTRGQSAVAHASLHTLSRGLRGV